MSDRTAEITKQQPQGGTIEIWKQLYQSQWEIAFAETMYLMAEQYHMELTVEVSGSQVPSPTLRFWRESLSELSPKQMREGLKLYMDSERRSFKPAPGDLKTNAPEANDKPRKTFKKDCPDCSGTGLRRVMVDSKIFAGKKIEARADCFCVRVEYDGQSFKPEQKALPPAPEIDPKKLLQRIGKKTGVELGREFPKRKDLDLNPNSEKVDRLKVKAFEVAERLKAGKP